MRLGILSDAHGNLEGFTRCFNYLLNQQVDQCIFLGDAIGYMPDGLLILDFLKSAGITCLMGNHEAMLLGFLPLSAANDAVYKLKQFCGKITREQIKFISSWVPFYQTGTVETKFLFVHGSPWNPANGYVYPDADFNPFADLPFDIVVMGHTHRPFVEQVGFKTIVNVGSCGLPRDKGNVLSCAIMETSTKEVRLITLPFDEDEVIQKYGKVVHPRVVECFKR
ncbi:metallophosphoesterase family protein [soil metagenome]